MNMNEIFSATVRYALETIEDIVEPEKKALALTSLAKAIAATGKVSEMVAEPTEAPVAVEHKGSEDKDEREPVVVKAEEPKKKAVKKAEKAEKPDAKTALKKKPAPVEPEPKEEAKEENIEGYSFTEAQMEEYAEEWDFLAENLCLDADDAEANEIRAFFLDGFFHHDNADITEINTDNIGALVTYIKGKLAEEEDAA